MPSCLICCARARLASCIGARVEPLPLGPRDLVARRVLLALEPFELGNQPAPRGLERGDLLERLVRIEPAVAQTGADLFDVIADEGRDRACYLGASIVYSRALDESSATMRP